MAKVDRISLLPEEIKISILSRLEVKDALRTSTLARSWRHIWTLLPSLRLGCYLDPLGDTSKDFNTRPVSSSWIRRVSRLISSLQGPFLLFELSLILDIIPSNLLQSILDLLFQKDGVQTLHLYCFYPNRLLPKVIVRLPLFHSLKVLGLSECQLVLPDEFRGFHCLTTLSLSDVKIPNHRLQLLLDTSKNLTSFMFSAQDLDLTPDLSVNISLPLLTRVQFGINEMVDNICLVSTPHLEEAHIFVNNPVSENLARVILRLLTDVSMVSSLHLDCDNLKALSLLGLPFSFSFPQLKCFKFFLNVDNMDKRTCDVIYWLLKSMPFLEELNIELFCFSKQTEGVASLMRELLLTRQNGVPCLDQTLKSVIINICLSLNAMTSITMVKFFLLNAKVLKLMKILYQDDERLSIIEELQKEEVASSDAKVVMFNIKTEVTVNVK